MTPNSEDLMLDVREANNSTVVIEEEPDNYCYLCRTFTGLAMDVRWKLTIVIFIIIILQWAIEILYW